MASDVIYGFEFAVDKDDEKKTLNLVFKYKFREEGFDAKGHVIENFVFDGKALDALKKAIAEVEHKPRIGFR